MRTWADWDEKRPGFVEIDLVGHEGGDNNGDFACSLTVTDIATGWTEVRSVRNKAARHVFCRLGGDPGGVAVPTVRHRFRQWQ